VAFNKLNNAIILVSCLAFKTWSYIYMVVVFDVLS
jgi:hypothetical protein